MNSLSVHSDSLENPHPRRGAKIEWCVASLGGWQVTFDLHEARLKVTLKVFYVTNKAVDTTCKIMHFVGDKYNYKDTRKLHETKGPNMAVGSSHAIHTSI